jgi:outer membrane protein OmpA-like peptidoglycan-associated protein
VNLTGTLSLQALAGNPFSGLVAGDESLVEVDGNPTGEFQSKDVGESVSVSVNPVSLKGAKAGNYTLQQVNAVTAKITKKPLKLLVAREYAKLKGDPDPSFDVSVDETKSFVAGEGLGTIGGATVSRANGQSSDTPGQVSLQIATGNAAGKNNYEVELVEGILHISDVEIVVTNNEDGSPNTVTCNCENLKDGEVVTLTMYSDPTEIATDTVVDGTCPNLKDLTLPDADGDHTLELTSLFPNGDPLTQLLPISFMIAGSGPPAVFSPGSSSLLPPTLVVTKAKFKKATVSWLPAIGDVASYRLYIDGKLVGSYSAKDRKAKIPGLTRNTLYRATLVALDRNNQSAFSQADFWTMNQKRLIVYFRGDSAKITKAERQRLRSLVRSLPINYRAEVSVVATVKRVPGRSFSSNKALADDRAKNVTRLLKKLGLKASFSVVGISIPESAQDRSRKAASKIKYVRLI